MFGLLVVTAIASLEASESSGRPEADWRAEPQIVTSRRLLKLGESIQLRFWLPPGHDAPAWVDIFACYLERARPGDRFVPGEPPAWLNDMEPEQIPLDLRGGEATLTYTPRRPGSYLLRWRVGAETLYRYFAAIEDDWTVLRFSTFEGLEADPPLHGTGLPLDYRLPVDRFGPADPLWQRFYSYHRAFGHSIIPAFPDTPTLSVEERVQAYGKGLARVRALMPDPSNARSARVEMRHALDPGYTQAFMHLGVNDHCGLNEANAKPWLGMPEFPYFASPVDCRKASQEPGASVVAHQWDFCGGWHFVGPVSWHYKAAAGDWAQAEHCLRQGMDEFALAARMSGHPIFAVPLYDGVTPAGYPNPSFRYQVAEPRRFCGEVREVFISDRALDETTIRRVMRSGVGAAPSARVAWPLGGGLSLPSGEAPETQEAVALGSEFTLGCWVKPAAAQDPWANLLSSHNNDPQGNHRGVSLEQDGHRTNRFYLIGGVGDGWVGVDTQTQLTAGEWQHFAVIRRGRDLVHYLNGRVSAQGSVPDTPFTPATDPFRLGDWARGGTADSQPMRAFVERYQRFIAFELPKQHKVAFARSIDIADYYREHFARTPRTVFSSRTDHLLYDRWWLCNWCSRNELITLQRLPWDTRVSSLHELRDGPHPFKDPLSTEYLLVEDHRRSIRFERECPNPIWWFDYTRQERGPDGSAIDYVRTPDVVVERSAWEHTADGLTLTLTMQTQATFPDYALCVWELPGQAAGSRVRSTAEEFLLARNRAGEMHLVLFFDLEPGAVVRVTLDETRSAKEAL